MNGLTSLEANKQLETHGYNELPSAGSKNIWHTALEVVKEPMFILLLSCGGLYILLGDYTEGVILLSWIFVVIFITFYQHQKTEKAVEALKKLSSPRALVIRDGKETRIAGREVVPNDIILLNEGDRVPADAKIIESINLTIDESMLTGESVAVTKNVEQDPNHAQGKIFSGTLVVQGKGKALVTSTGIKTEFGKIGTSLQTIEVDQTRLQKEMKILIRNLFIIGGVISVITVIAFYFTKGNFIQSLLNGLAAAMAILPEEFPIVLTVFLALGAWRLSKKNVLTRKPSAIETLGSATVLCSDKTGTITQNKMEIAALYNGKAIVTKNDFNAQKVDLEAMILAAQNASQKDSIDPMEKAINLTHEKIISTKVSSSELIKEYPLSKELLAMTRVMQDEKKQISVSTKGSPEAIFKLCKMTDAENAKNLAIVQQLAEQGYRVIGVAHGTNENKPLPNSQQEFKLEFLGLIALEDPIRPEVPQAIKECKDAGIKVVIITGDFPATAKSIAKQIGLDTTQEVITGAELKNITDEELRTKIMHTNIFARVVPEQKLRIVQALKANNEVVAMTGDGVNDAPALKAAHIGIAMGGKGTDVAREASSLVLLDDNFASIVSSIRLGRRIFDNLQKAMSYIIAIHIPIIGLTLLPAFFSSLPILLMPLHIVFMEMIIDPVCSIAFESEQEEKGIMNRSPRKIEERFFNGAKMISSVIRGLLLLTMVLVVYFLSINEGHTAGEVRAITFSSLIIGNIFLILTNLSKTRSFISVFVEKNQAAILITVLAMLMLFLILYIPYLGRIFSFEFPGYTHFIPSLLGASVLLIVLELVKYFSNRNLKVK
jgi:Ca2+-transporting ATPase